MLDGAVLVVSAVEGVQAQTRVLIAALRRLGIPTLIFVNKIDRRGARDERVLRGVAGTAVAGGRRDGRRARPRDPRRVVRAAPGGDAAFTRRLAELLAERDDALLAAYVEGDELSHRRLRRALAAQTRRAQVHPVYFGSAITGAGVDVRVGDAIGASPAGERRQFAPPTLERSSYPRARADRGAPPRPDPARRQTR